jgi:hypothetical protein
LVPRGTDDEIHLQVLLVKEWTIMHFLFLRAASHLDAELFAILVDTNELPPSQDPMRPLPLIYAKSASLMIHHLIQVLNQLETNNPVVGGTCIR